MYQASKGMPAPTRGQHTTTAQLRSEPARAIRDEGDPERGAGPANWRPRGAGAPETLEIPAEPRGGAIGGPSRSRTPRGTILSVRRRAAAGGGVGVGGSAGPVGRGAQVEGRGRATRGRRRRRRPIADSGVEGRCTWARGVSAQGSGAAWGK
jgi:hypothetical protein